MAERMKNMIFSCLIGIVSFAVMISFVFFSSDCIPETRNALYNFFDTVFQNLLSKNRRLWRTVSFFLQENDGI